MNSNRGVKRKKKSFRQKSLKYHKKGLQGKGVRIDDDTFEYFLHILKVMNQEFESEEDKRSFVENVFEQLEGNEVNYSCNQVVSRIAENLLPYTSDERLEKFMNSFSGNMRPICMDPFGSFVLQKLISTVAQRFTDCENSADKKFNEEYQNWLLKTFKFVLNNVEEFIFNRYANHVMRTTISCIAGETNSSGRFDQDVYPYRDFERIINDFIDHLLEWSMFNELPFDNLPSGFLQILLQSASKIDNKRTELLCSTLVNRWFFEKSDIIENKTIKFSPAFENESCIRLLEVMLGVAPPVVYNLIYIKLFVNRLVELAQHQQANFAVQKLIKYCREKSEFEAIFDELSNSFDSILEKGNSGVVLHLCEACMRFKSRQSVFLQLWMKYLRCNEPAELQISVALLTVFMKKQNQYDETMVNNVNLHGSLLIQNLLKFGKPIKVINSILNMKTASLVSILCNPKGSHIANAFFESEYVGEKSKDKFIRILQDHYTALATSKHGSRVFDIVWHRCNLKNRIMIVTELLENESTLQASPFGRPIVHQISLSSFRRNREEWIKAQSKTNHVKKLFANIM